jgi:glycosyltransferase involved in cell wall biosynthesis
VVTEENVIAVRPDDPDALAAGIREAVEDRETAARKARLAKETSRRFTYEYKVGEFLAFFDSLAAAG